MKDTQNEFYSSIAKYYHEIFPYNPVQLNFIKNNCRGLPGKVILDVGCATGELSSELAIAGAEVTGIDLNDDLLHRAQLEKIHSRLNFQKGDMLRLHDYFRPRQFDAVVCFGNTLVHLPTENHVKKFLDNVASVLKPGGIFMLQILNYDYILEEPVTELPLIETENIKFIRRYKITPGQNVIGFETDLHLKKEGTTIANETPLLALRSRPLEKMLKAADFKDILFFSSFREDEFGGKHLPLVVKAVSKE